MRYKVALKHSDEGFSVSVPGLPGCWSQGDTEPEALANIREAIASIWKLPLSSTRMPRSAKSMSQSECG